MSAAVAAEALPRSRPSLKPLAQLLRPIKPGSKWQLRPRRFTVPMTPVARHLRTAIAEAVRSGRAAMGWSLRELASRAAVSKAMVGLVEAGRSNVTVDTAGKLLSTLGVVVELRIQLPYADVRQRDAPHARCVAYVQRRLEAAGWLVVREVEILDGRSRGWIDLLAFHPDTRDLLVIEVKTQIDDLGRIERTVAWYRRTSVAAARRFGWRPRLVRTWLLVLATELNETRIAENRDALGQSFPDRADTMLAGSARAGLALIDPRRRRRDWLMRARVDGRRSPAPYRDYADFVRQARGQVERE